MELEIKKFQIFPKRNELNSGYIGSYACDGLSMALHCLCHTNSFEKCVLKVINLKGDADSVGAKQGRWLGLFIGLNQFLVTAKK